MSRSSAGTLPRRVEYQVDDLNEGEIVAFVNHYFSPDQPDDTRSAAFWDQIERLGPESYLSDGSECVTFVSRNADLFPSVCEAFAIAEVRID